MNPDGSQNTNPPASDAAQAANPTAQNDTTNQANPATADQQTQAPDYIEDVGGDMIGLLDEISGDDTLVQKVADEMELDKEKVHGILTPLLNKIDQGQITVDEIALIMASTVVDEDTNTEEENNTPAA